jgi:hypothetical protein
VRAPLSLVGASPLSLVGAISLSLVGAVGGAVDNAGRRRREEMALSTELLRALVMTPAPFRGSRRHRSRQSQVPKALDGLYGT